MSNSKGEYPMPIKSTILTYPLLLILSTGKKSCTNIGRLIKKGSHWVASILQPAEKSFDVLHKLCQSIFSEKKKLYLIIDDTLIKKIFALNMQGTGMFYDTKIGRSINAFRLVIAMISDGRNAIPITCSYLFSKELVDLCTEKFTSKEEIVKSFVDLAYKLFPSAEIVTVADGLYASVKFLKWSIENKKPAEVRMRSNCVVTRNGVKNKLSELINHPCLRLTGRRTARTFSAVWHDLSLEITMVKRIDKHGVESIVFQAATYKAEPRQHVKAYKIRWNVEKHIRTGKQYLGLGDCFSTSLEIQYNHTAAVLLAYAIAQIEMKKQRLKKVEDSIRALKEKFNTSGFYRFVCGANFFSNFDA